MKYVPLFKERLFWATKWEVRVDRSGRAPMSSRDGTDQRVQHPASVASAALLIKSCTQAAMQTCARCRRCGISCSGEDICRSA